MRATTLEDRSVIKVNLILKGETLEDKVIDLDHVKEPLVIKLCR
jgi:hypothetical protein